jgi:hypothetical protein
MSEIDIYDTVINGYYTFTQYWEDINRVIVKIIQIIKTQYPDLSYEDILEKVKLIFITEGFPSPTITDSEILENFEEIADDTSTQNISSSIALMQNILNSMNALNYDDEEQANEDEQNNEEEINDEQLNLGNEEEEQVNPENNNEDINEDDVHMESHNVNIANLMQIFTQHLLNSQQNNTQVQLPSIPVLQAQPNLLVSYISDNNNDSGQVGNQSNVSQGSQAQQQVQQAPQLQFGLFAPIGTIGGGINSFLNKKVNVVVDKNVLKKFRNRQYKFLSDKIKELNKTCTICLDDYEESSKVKVLPCEHGFHTECITKWLTNENYKCPVCRKEIGTNEDHKIIDS